MSIKNYSSKIGKEQIFIYLNTFFLLKVEKCCDLISQINFLTARFYFQRENYSNHHNCYFSVSCILKFHQSLIEKG